MDGGHKLLRKAMMRSETPMNMGILETTHAYRQPCKIAMGVTSYSLGELDAENSKIFTPSFNDVPELPTRFYSPIVAAYMDQSCVFSRKSLIDVLALYWYFSETHWGEIGFIFIDSTTYIGDVGTKHA